MNFTHYTAAIAFMVLLGSCSKDVLGVTDPGTGNPPPPTIVIKRSSQEAYNAKRFGSSKYSSSNPGVFGGGIFTISYQDIYFDAAGGNPSDAVRPVMEKNLLLVGLTMQYQTTIKGGLQDFGGSSRVQFNEIDLFSAPHLAAGAVQGKLFKRNFAFTRDNDGTISGAAGYEGSAELYDKNVLDFFYTRPVVSITQSDTVNDFTQQVKVNPGILFDSGYVFNAANDAVITLNRTISKGSIISFEKLRGPSSAYPYIPSIVSYELLTDTNAVRIPKEEVKYILDVLRISTGVTKTFGVKYPFWLNVIESGVCDTIPLTHAVNGSTFQFEVYQYFEFGRKMYLK